MIVRYDGRDLRSSFYVKFDKDEGGDFCLAVARVRTLRWKTGRSTGVSRGPSRKRLVRPRHSRPLMSVARADAAGECRLGVAIKPVLGPYYLRSDPQRLAAQNFAQTQNVPRGPVFGTQRVGTKKRSGAWSV